MERKNGADGKVEVNWKTEDMSAKTGRDYEGGEGVLIFEHGETTKTIEIPIYDDQASRIIKPGFFFTIVLAIIDFACC